MTEGESRPCTFTGLLEAMTRLEKPTCVEYTVAATAPHGPPLGLWPTARFLCIPCRALRAHRSKRHPTVGSAGVVTVGQFPQDRTQVERTLFALFGGQKPRKDAANDPAFHCSRGCGGLFHVQLSGFIDPAAQPFGALQFETATFAVGDDGAPMLAYRVPSSGADDGNTAPPLMDFFPPGSPPEPLELFLSQFDNNCLLFYGTCCIVAANDAAIVTLSEYARELPPSPLPLRAVSPPSRAHSFASGSSGRSRSLSRDGSEVATTDGETTESRHRLGVASVRRPHTKFEKEVRRAKNKLTRWQWQPYATDSSLVRTPIAVARQSRKPREPPTLTMESRHERRGQSASPGPRQPRARSPDAIPTQHINFGPTYESDTEHDEDADSAGDAVFEAEFEAGYERRNVLLPALAAALELGPQEASDLHLRAKLIGTSKGPTAVLQFRFVGPHGQYFAEFFAGLSADELERELHIVRLTRVHCVDGSVTGSFFTRHASAAIWRSATSFNRAPSILKKSFGVASPSHPAKMVSFRFGDGVEPLFEIELTGTSRTASVGSLGPARRGCRTESGSAPFRTPEGWAGIAICDASDSAIPSAASSQRGLRPVIDDGTGLCGVV